MKPTPKPIANIEHIKDKWICRSCRKEKTNVTKDGNVTEKGDKKKRPVETYPQPTFDECVKFIEKTPDHTHYNYFMKPIGSDWKPQIKYNDTMLMRFMDLQRDVVKK